jgi:hypothetical protein
MALGSGISLHTVRWTGQFHASANLFNVSSSVMLTRIQLIQSQAALCHLLVHRAQSKTCSRAIWFDGSQLIIQGNASGETGHRVFVLPLREPDGPFGLEHRTAVSHHLNVFGRVGI